MSKRVKIALTMGCPKGIGPELALSTLANLSENHEITIYGDPEILDEAAQGKCSIAAKLSSRQAGEISFAALEEATNAVIKGAQDILVTCPINKSYWHEAGVPFTGHTEYLADATGTKDYAMLLAGPKLKVALATIHVAVKDVPAKLTTAGIFTATRLMHQTMQKYFGVPKPRIGIAALNPHCGDLGLMGNEEDTIIRPAIDLLQAETINATGPFPGDTIFRDALGGKFDAVIAMYHDQGLAPIKTLDFNNTVNITMGLPIIRTSVDHGTAEDIAWKGIADNTNLIAAINMAARIYSCKKEVM